MPRIHPVEAEQTVGHSRTLLDGVGAKFGRTPNLMRTLAHSPLPSEDTWISVSLFNGDCFPRPFGEQIALAVGEIKGCNYCLATNTTIGEMIGLSEQELLDSRSGEAGDKKSRATLSFARHLVVERGAVADDVLAEARDAGLSDGELEAA